MIVAEDAHVTYRVYASGKRLSARESVLNANAFRGGRALHSVPALRGVSFAAHEGETIGVVGHNGSGKSTLFRAMSGLIPTSQGTIRAADRPVLLGVNAALVPELSGENNIKLGLLAMGFTAEEAVEKVDEIADFAELNEFLYHPMRTYSSGMGARLRFAIASAKAHSILLIDEALSVGDRRFKLKSEGRIRALRDNAGLVMIVSHSVGSLKDTCDRVLWIHKGELRADGPTKDVIDDYVRWTKQPGSTAVGAASPTSGKRAAGASNGRNASADDPTASAPEAAATQFARDKTRVPEPAVSPLEKLLADAALDAKEIIAPTEGLRTVARRERYRQEASERVRRRVMIGLITGAAILVAAAAGAAVAAVGSMSRAGDDATTPRALAAAPTIGGFSASAPTAACAAPTGTADISLSWASDDAVWVALAQGAATVDAIDQPLVSGLTETAEAYTVAFPCTEESRVYTLTVAGGEGSRVSSTVTVARVLPPEPTATPVPDDEVETDTYTDDSEVDNSTGDSGTSNGSEVITEETSPTQDPEPSPTAQPTDPAPSPQPEETQPVDPSPPAEEVPAG